MKEITLVELREHKEALEIKLIRTLSQEFDAFREKTGFSVHGLSMDYIEHTAFGDDHPVTSLARVTVRLEEI